MTAVRVLKKLVVMHW